MSRPEDQSDIGEYGAIQTLVRGLKLAPELRIGLPVTLLLALIATVGKIVVPVVSQRIIDDGVLLPGGPQAGTVVGYALFGAATLGVTVTAGYAMNYRLFRATEHALSALRIRAFRHIHDLSLAHHESEHPGALVSRVTADVDTISRFMQHGGILLIVSLGQLMLATVVMAFYSLPLTALVLVIVTPLVFVLRWFQARLSVAYAKVRERVATTLSTISEGVMGAPVVRAYSIEDRTDQRSHDAVERQFRTHYGATRLAGFMFSTGEMFAAFATAGALALGVMLGAGGNITAGQLVAFMFLINLFIQPVQITTEVLDQAQTAIAGWRRILQILDIPAQITDPAEEPHGGQRLPPGPVSVQFTDVGFAYPVRGAPDRLGPRVLQDISVVLRPGTSTAIVGETGSGKTTFAKLLTRLADPTAGTITLSDVPLLDVRFDSLRGRVVIVPQDDFLFDTTIAANVRLGAAHLTDEQIVAAFEDLGLGDWLLTLPQGANSLVGERGDRLSVGERQLVSLVRAYVADPDLLILDEATSAVDPATETRLTTALQRVTAGRTSVTIAHRLSTAEQADQVLVFDAGRLVQRGVHHELAAVEGPYQELYASWTAHRAPVA